MSERMTKEEYESWWSNGEPIPEGWHAVPCECSRNDCLGWQMQGPEEREHKEALRRLFPDGGVLA